MQLCDEINDWNVYYVNLMVGAKNVNNQLQP